MIKRCLYTWQFRFLLVFAAVGMLDCKSAEAPVAPEVDATLTELQSLIESQAYRIDINTVRPFNTAATTRVINALLTPTTGNNAQRIYVSGQGHFIQLQDNLAQASLPFFGEQRQGGGQYGNRDVGIQIDGTPENYKVFRHKKNPAVVATFTANHAKRSTENYDVIITVFANKQTEIAVFSSHRTSIRYSGILKMLENSSP